MAIKSRLTRLETALVGKSEPGQKTFDEAVSELIADDITVGTWLKQRGFDSVLEALAAGEAGPELIGEGHNLEFFAKCERDVVSERIHAALFPNISMWCHRERGWCAPINGRLVFLGPRDEYTGAVTNFRRLTCQVTDVGGLPDVDRSMKNGGQTTSQ